MRYQVWWGIADSDRNKSYQDCMNDVSKYDLDGEVRHALSMAKAYAEADVEDGGSHYRPFVLVMAEIDDDIEASM